MKRLHVLFATAIIVHFGLLRADEPLKVFPGAALGDINRPLSATEFAPRLESSREFMESYSFWILLDDGGSMLVNLPITNLPSPGGCSVAVNYYRPDRSGLLAEAQFDSDDLRTTDTKVQCGPNRLERLEDGRYQFGARLPIESGAGHLEIELEATPLLPGFKRGDGKVHYGDEGKYFELKPLAPLCKLTGTLTLEGEAKRIAGRAYFDYAGQNLWAHQVANFWLSYRFFSEELYIASATWITPPAYGTRTIHHIFVAEGNKPLFVTGRQSLWFSKKKRDPASDYDVPGAFRVEIEESGYQVSFAADLADQLLGRKDILEPLPAIARAVIRTFIARPYNYRYRLPIQVQVRAPDGSTKTVSGTLLAEMIFVND